MLDSVPLLPSATPFRAARGRRERQPTSTGPPTTGVRHALRERLDPEELFTALAPAHDNPRFDVQSLTSAGTCTVIVSGEVDSMTAPGLRDCLLDVLGRPHLREVQVEVDLSRVAFLNAAGLTALAIAHQMADSAGRVLRIRCGTARAVLRPLQITGLWYAFDTIEQGSSRGNVETDIGTRPRSSPCRGAGTSTGTSRFPKHSPLGRDGQAIRPVSTTGGRE